MSQLLAGAGAGCCSCPTGGGFCSLALSRLYSFPAARFPRLRVSFTYTIYLSQAGTCFQFGLPVGPCSFQYDMTHSSASLNKRYLSNTTNEVRWETCCNRTPADPSCFPSMCPDMGAAPNVRAFLYQWGDNTALSQCSWGFSDHTFRLSIQATHTLSGPGTTCVCCQQTPCGPGQTSLHPNVSCAPAAIYYRRCCNYLNGPLGTYVLDGPSTVINSGSAGCGFTGTWQRTASLTATVSEATE